MGRPAAVALSDWTEQAVNVIADDGRYRNQNT